MGCMWLCKWDATFHLQIIGFFGQVGCLHPIWRISTHLHPVSSMGCCIPISSHLKPILWCHHLFKCKHMKNILIKFYFLLLYLKDDAIDIFSVFLYLWDFLCFAYKNICEGCQISMYFPFDVQRFGLWWQFYHSISCLFRKRIALCI